MEHNFIVGDPVTWLLIRDEYEKRFCGKIVDDRDTQFMVKCSDGHYRAVDIDEKSLELDRPFTKEERNQKLKEDIFKPVAPNEFLEDIDASFEIVKEVDPIAKAFPKKGQGTIDNPKDIVFSANTMPVTFDEIKKAVKKLHSAYVPSDWDGKTPLDNGLAWDAPNLTIKGLDSQPKFKVGDVVKHKDQRIEGLDEKET